MEISNKNNECHACRISENINRRLDEHQNQLNDLMRVLKIMSNGLQSIDMALYDLRGKLYLAMEPIYRQLSKVIND